jgi:hypothetical protein
MDETRLAQYGDAEYTPRMRKLGWKLIIEPRAKVFCKPNDVVEGYRKLSIWDKVRESFLRPTGPYSFKRRFYANLAAAPNVLQAIAAIPVFYLRVLIGKNPEGRWAMSQPESRLADVYTDSRKNGRP